MAGASMRCVSGRGTSAGLLLLLTMLVGACAVACDSGGARYQPMQHYTLEGIPVPRGFTLVDDHSVGVSSGETRVAKMEFQGAGDRGGVTRFYREIMSETGWTLKKEDFDRGVYDMRFVNREEECTVRLRSEWNKVIGTIHVMPLPPGNTAREGTPRDAGSRAPVRDSSAGRAREQPGPPPRR